MTLLPEPPKPSAKYLAVVEDDGLLYVAGQTAFTGSEMRATGVVGVDLGLDEARACARLCALNVLAQVRAHTGDLDAVERVLRVGVFVAAAPGYNQHHLVADGASDVFQEVLGTRGGHVRSTVGVTGLPRRSPVEVDAVVRLCRPLDGGRRMH